MSSSSSLNMIGWLIGSRALNTNTKVSPRGSREEGKNCNLKYIYGAPRTHSSVPGFWIIYLKLSSYDFTVPLFQRMKEKLKRRKDFRGKFFQLKERKKKKPHLFVVFVSYEQDSLRCRVQFWFWEENQADRKTFWSIFIPMYPTSKLKTFFLIFETSQGFEAIFFQYLVFAVHIFIAHNSTGFARAHQFKTTTAFSLR